MAVPAGAAAAATGATGTGRYVVVYRDSVPDVDTKVDRDQAAGGFRSKHRYHHALKGFAAELSARQLDRLRRDPDVALVGDDRPVHVAGLVPLGTGERVPTGVARVGAASSAAGVAGQASSVGVAVLDTGVSLSHPDLTVVDAHSCVTNVASADDDNGHGTHVAGVVAARNSGNGVVGVAPGTKIYAVKVLDANGFGTFSDLVCGIDWVTANAAALNIKVGNLSVVGPGGNDNDCGRTNADALHLALCRATFAGVSYTVAAGNDGANLAAALPAAYPEVLSVTAVADGDGQPGQRRAPTCADDPNERDDAYAAFSNYAALGSAEASHTIAAPGVCIESTWLGGGYATISGTSMAAPHIAGLLAGCFGDAGGPGPCAGLAPTAAIAKLRSLAASYDSADPGYGFDGDPVHPVAGRFYGNLPHVGPLTAPAAPVSLTATAGSSQVSLSWSAAAAGGRAASFDVYRGTASGTEVLLRAGLPSPSWTDLTGTDGQLYYYAVLARNSVGASGLSAEVRAASLVPTAPPTGAPTNVVATRRDPDSVSLSWAAPTTGVPPKGYSVYRSSPGGSETRLVVGQPGLGYVDAAPYDTTWSYRVVAVNAAGEGPAATVTVAADPVAAKYTALVAANIRFGNRVGAELALPGGALVQRYDWGTIYWSAGTGAHEIHGALRDRYDALGGPAAVGLPLTDESPAADGQGRYNIVASAILIWSPASGAYEVHGAIRDSWSGLRAQDGLLGYPLSNEQGTPNGAGRFNVFQGGSVYWSPGSGAHEVHGAIRERWASMGGESGLLGFPVSDERAASGG
ncbi:MAG: S8 family serine peptidase, partial [Actinomycetota bacterium]|nr:S8 family serine peptidase [Actinomycetota bacterium]